MRDDSSSKEISVENNDWSTQNDVQPGFLTGRSLQNRKATRKSNEQMSKYKIKNDDKILYTGGFPSEL